MIVCRGVYSVIHLRQIGGCLQVIHVFCQIRQIVGCLQECVYSVSYTRQVDVRLSEVGCELCHLLERCRLALSAGDT